MIEIEVQSQTVSIFLQRVPKNAATLPHFFRLRNDLQCIFCRVGRYSLTHSPQFSHKSASSNAWLSSTMIWLCCDYIAWFITLLHCIYVFSIVGYADSMLTLFLMPLFTYQALSDIAYLCLKCH